MQKKSLTERAADRWFWCVDNWHISGIMIIIFAVLAFGGWKKYHSWQAEVQAEAKHAAQIQHQQEVAAEAERLEALKPWAPLPEPPLPAIGTLPAATPTLDPLGFTVSDDDGKNLMPGSPKTNALQLRLKRLVETHPRTEINTEFNTRVASGELMLNFQPQRGEIAAFTVMPQSMVSSMQKTDNRKLLPVFIMSLTALANIDTPEEIRKAWLVLYHENHHYEQYLAAPADEKALFVSRAVKVGERMTQRECDHMWNVERDAYQTECHLALDWGMPDVWSGVCRKVGDDAAFSQALFLWMERSSPVQSCFQSWATSAGHPHPEAYAIPR